jgi:hypothetical protein
MKTQIMDEQTKVYNKDIDYDISMEINKLFEKYKHIDTAQLVTLIITAVIDERLNLALDL